MTDEECLKQLAKECPRHILGVLHLRGHYAHYTSRERPGKVLCLDCQGTVYGDYRPTEAQAHATARLRRLRAEEDECDEGGGTAR